MVAERGSALGRLNYVQQFQENPQEKKIQICRE